MGQKAFYFNMAACVGCHACQIACRDKNSLYDVGEIFRRVDIYEGGNFPHPWVYALSTACNHCALPLCVPSCPTGALHKDEETGLVLHDDTHCTGCGNCLEHCPYHAPILLQRAGRTIAAKCDGCHALILTGQQPVCVEACSMRALEFGELDALRQLHPNAVSCINALPTATTQPSLLIDPIPEAIDEKITQVM